MRFNSCHVLIGGPVGAENAEPLHLLNGLSQVILVSFRDGALDLRCGLRGGIVEELTLDGWFSVGDGVNCLTVKVVEEFARLLSGQDVIIQLHEDLRHVRFGELLWSVSVVDSAGHSLVVVY